MFCTNSLIPSVFPLMVITGILSNISINDLFSKKSILDKCRNYNFDIILGNLCGFTAGAKNITDKYKNSSKNSILYSNSVILSTNAGIAYVISFVGIYIWNSIIFGILLYFLQIFASYILGKLILPKSNESNENLDIRQMPIFNNITNSISSGTLSIAYICGYTIFFSVILDLILIIPFNKSLSSLLSSLTEISRGITDIMNLNSNILASFFTGFSVGFGGFCVALQIFSCCKDAPLNKGLYLMFKLIQGVICGFGAIALTKLLNLNVSKIKDVILINSFTIHNALIASLFLISLIAIIKNKIRKFK